jgi:hypothetical protein
MLELRELFPKELREVLCGEISDSTSKSFTTSSVKAVSTCEGFDASNSRESFDSTF